MWYTNTESHINIMLKNGEMAPWSHHPKGRKGSQVREGGAPRRPGRGPVPPMGAPRDQRPCPGGGGQRAIVLEREVGYLEPSHKRGTRASQGGKPSGPGHPPGAGWACWPLHGGPNTPESLE